MAIGLCAKRMKWHVAETIEMYTLDQNRVSDIPVHTVGHTCQPEKVRSVLKSVENKMKS